MIRLVLAGEIVPKARPRFANGHSYLPARYRHWKERAIGELKGQWGDNRPVVKGGLKIEIFNQSRGDLDNIAGAILDALVAAEILTDDRISCLTRLEIESVKTEDKVKKTVITLCPDRVDSV